ncbi:MULTISPECIES: thermonuclease family protein [unclassified Rhizobium]|uniref:thermonuclease family protein n=1 Tax=unclassified Rhizobium TaxID=2613769 RepID=UPI001A98B375|nr:MULTISPECIES: thermonuclease family protein [unclassified Rhizobium]MBX5159369.1 thermonuclease family protein [Rhizobium sp. NZLR8]MBX5167716.1 thermonuclease family protein [Rhizobium sp. NZLR4b]MBX5170875.1 thermonuclease family protein [Rhizobium sp. NZLR1b]MBX5181653.1 thermonuclease family protein [Rhizobium sp. NZLR5]MBX5188557.1 thermonuclease family protein [Rhizobium sp. NZLR3b]
MRLAALFTGLTGMAVVAGLLMAGETRLRGGTAGEESVSAEETATSVDPAAQAGEPAAMSDDRAEVIARSAQPPAPPSPRPADGTAPKPADIAPPAETAAGQAANPSAKKPMELTRPAVENAGMLSFGERRLQLAGVVPTPADRICGPAGRQWPCGMMAKTALRQLLRNRSIACDIDPAEWKEMATTACRLGTQDLGAWLAENGWAEVAAGSPLASAAEKARQAGKGLYGDDPRRR